MKNACIQIMIIRAFFVPCSRDSSLRIHSTMMAYIEFPVDADADTMWFAILIVLLVVCGEMRKTFTMEDEKGYW